MHEQRLPTSVNIDFNHVLNMGQKLESSTSPANGLDLSGQQQEQTTKECDMARWSAQTQLAHVACKSFVKWWVLRHPICNTVVCLH